MTAALLTIGTELTRGELHDRNGGELAARLTQRGYEVTEICSVDDDDDRIVATLQRLALIHEIVLCTGGLGPTTDDRTSSCAARAQSVPLELDPAAYEHLTQMMKARGRVITPASEKQARFPQGAQVLPNPRGTAPGFSNVIGRCRFFFMPGVPSEMDAMFEESVLRLLPPPPTPTSCIRLRTYGLPEVEVNDRLAGLEEEHGITIGYRASHSEIEVKLLAQGKAGESQADVDARNLAAQKAVRERLGDIVYAEGTTSLSETIGRLLQKTGLTLGLAESCTGGLVSEMITSVPGASAYYLGGICSYANSVKVNLLDVSETTLAEVGAVSETVARQMAQGTRESLKVDVALALTGVAGPGGGSKEKPVGLVHYAVATPDGIETFQKIFRGTRAQIQRRAALAGLWQVRAALMRKA